MLGSGRYIFPNARTTSATSVLLRPFGDRPPPVKLLTTFNDVLLRSLFVLAIQTSLCYCC